MARFVTWDVKRGRALWAEGWSASRIALEMGMKKSAIIDYARNHDWPARRVRTMATADDYARAAARMIPAPPPPRVKPVRDRAAVIVRWERRKYERRQRDKIADARRLFLVLEEGMKPKRGRPKKQTKRLAPLDTRAAA